MRAMRINPRRSLPTVRESFRPKVLEWVIAMGSILTSRGDYLSDSVEVVNSITDLSRALELLSDRKQPDYRNSIKESISAVEATCQVFASKSRATLGD